MDEKLAIKLEEMLTNIEAKPEETRLIFSRYEKIIEKYYQYIKTNILFDKAKYHNFSTFKEAFYVGIVKQLIIISKNMNSETLPLDKPDIEEMQYIFTFEENDNNHLIDKIAKNLNNLRKLLNTVNFIDFANSISFKKLLKITDFYINNRKCNNQGTSIEQYFYIREQWKLQGRVAFYGIVENCLREIINLLICEFGIEVSRKTNLKWKRMNKIIFNINKIDINYWKWVNYSTNMKSNIIIPIDLIENPTFNYDYKNFDFMNNSKRTFLYINDVLEKIRVARNEYHDFEDHGYKEINRTSKITKLFYRDRFYDEIGSIHYFLEVLFEIINAIYLRIYNFLPEI